jgi:RHS repeat-associated protein
VFANTFDALGRKTGVSITPASGIGGTTAQAFQYDGLSRTTSAVDTVGSASAGVTLVYDSLSRVVEESQAYQGNTRNVTNAAFRSSPVTGFTLPNNRQLTNAYDALYRRTQVQETSGGSPIASWQFFGPARPAEVTLGNGLIATWMNNARANSAVQSPNPGNPAWGDQSSDRLGYDGAGRAIGKRYLAGGLNSGTPPAYSNATAVVGFTTAFDRAGDKLFERHLHAEPRSHLYEPFDANGKPEGGYDSLDRLLQYQRGTLASGGGLNGAGGGSISTAITLSGTDSLRTYELDGLGNWRRTGFTPVSGSAETEVRQHNGLNQITRTQDGAAQVNLTYDGAAGASNGNLENDGTRTYTWDALNRLVQVSKAGSVVIAQYSYDALSRRIRRVVSNGGLSGDIPAGTTDFLYAGPQCVEERDGSNTPTMQYVWGIYLDEIIQQNLLAGLNGFSAGVFYPLQDLLYRTTGLADAGGTVREAYDTDAYGNTLIFRNGTPPAAIGFSDSDSQVDYPTCPFIFTGQRFDPETGLYFYRARYYGAGLGRFVGKDPVGFAGGVNLYGYCGNGPTGATDPPGTYWQIIELIALCSCPHRHPDWPWCDDPISTDAFAVKAASDPAVPADNYYNNLLNHQTIGGHVLVGGTRCEATKESANKCPPGVPGTRFVCTVTLVNDTTKPRTFVTRNVVVDQCACCYVILNGEYTVLVGPRKKGVDDKWP